MYWGLLDIVVRFKEWKVKNLILVKFKERISYVNLVIFGFGVVKIFFYYYDFLIGKVI